MHWELLAAGVSTLSMQPACTTLEGEPVSRTVYVSGFHICHADPGGVLLHCCLCAVCGAVAQLEAEAKQQGKGGAANRRAAT